MRGEFDSLRGNKNGDMVEWLRRRSAKSVTWVRILLSPQRVRWKPKNRWWIYVHQNAEWSGTRDGSYLTLEWLNTITRYNLPCWRNGSVFVLHAKGSGSIPLRGTIKWLTLHNGLQRKCIWVAKVVRIRQPDCKSGPHGSGSSPLLSTKWWISVWKNVDNSDYNKRNYNPLPVHSKTTIKQSRVRRNGYLTIILIGD